MYRFFLTNHGFFAAVSPAADIMTAVAVARGFGMQVQIYRNSGADGNMVASYCPIAGLNWYDMEERDRYYNARLPRPAPASLASRPEDWKPIVVNSKEAADMADREREIAYSATSDLKLLVARHRDTIAKALHFYGESELAAQFQDLVREATR